MFRGDKNLGEYWREEQYQKGFYNRKLHTYNPPTAITYNKSLILRSDKAFRKVQAIPDTH